MHQNKLALAVIASLAVAGCGGSGGGSVTTPSSTPKIQFSSQISFGDSLSDVGTYAVGTIAASGGGRYTVNSTLASGAPAPTNWTELVAATLNQSAPCPNQTGLQGLAAYGFSVPVVTNAACTAYGQGGSMVTNPYGPGNANNPVDGSPVLGQLTVPVVTQMQNHLAAHGGTFNGKEVIFVLAGGNDAIYNFTYFAGSVQAAAAAGAAAGGAAGAAAAAASEATTAGTAAVQAMGLAGGQLAGYVNNLLLANGAKYVVVLNIPDLSTTPFGFGAEAQLPGSQSLINTMVTTFNSQLKAGLTSPNVLYVDVNTVSHDQVVNPSIYGLTNVSATACNLAYGKNILATPTALGSSLVCNGSNVIAGDISHYEFADLVHPTPYGNVLLARYVGVQLATKGWL